MECDPCGASVFTKAGRDRAGRQLYRCAGCRRRLTTRSGSACSGYQFPDEVLALSVRWNLCYRLSYADLAEWLAERGVYVDRSTLNDWVLHFTRLHKAARPHWHQVGERWSVDASYMRVGGRWAYLYRAIDEDGQVIDVLLQADAHPGGVRQDTVDDQATVG